MSLHLLKRDGNNLVFEDYSKTLRALTGEETSVEFGGNLKVKGEYLYYRGYDNTKRRLLGALTGNTGTPYKIKVKGQCIRYIDHYGDERQICVGECVALPYGSWLEDGDQVWLTTWQASVSEKISSNNSTIITRVMLVPTGFPPNQKRAHIINRGFLYFPPVPTEGMTAARIRFHGHAELLNCSSVTLQVQNGQPDYPSVPLVKADYDKDYYSGNGGQKFFDNEDLGYFYIELTEEGMSWINSDTITKFCLRTTRDIAGTPHLPDGDFEEGDTRYENVWMSGASTPYTDQAPKLIIDY